MVAYFQTNMTNPFGVLVALFSMVDVLKFVIFSEIAEISHDSGFIPSIRGGKLQSGDGDTETCFGHGGYCS